VRLFARPEQSCTARILLDLARDGRCDADSPPLLTSTNHQPPPTATTTTNQPPPLVQGAIREYQQTLINSVQVDIQRLQDKFKQQYEKSMSARLSDVRDLPPVSGEIIWARQIDRQLSECVVCPSCPSTLVSMSFCASSLPCLLGLYYAMLSAWQSDGGGGGGRTISPLSLLAHGTQQTARSHSAMRSVALARAVDALIPEAPETALHYEERRLLQCAIHRLCCACALL
jgi:hypothetical protein